MKLQWRDGHCIVKVETLAAHMIFVLRKIENIPIILLLKKNSNVLHVPNNFFSSDH